MQTVLYVPPTVSDGVDDVLSHCIGNLGQGNDSSRITADDADVEATESARDVPSLPIGDDGMSKIHRQKSSQATDESRSVSGSLIPESPSFASLERNVFELADKFRKDIMAEMESMKGCSLFA